MARAARVEVAHTLLAEAQVSTAMEDTATRQELPAAPVSLAPGSQVPNLDSVVEGSSLAAAAVRGLGNPLQAASPAAGGSADVAGTAAARNASWTRLP